MIAEQIMIEIETNTAGRTITADCWNHPEIGWCLWENAGAQSHGSAYDNISRVPPAIVQEAPDAFQTALGSDGWWWRICHPWRYGLTE